MSLASVNDVCQGAHEIGCKQMNGDRASYDEGSRHLEERGEAMSHDGSVAVGG
jgi:hypothetical protein